MSEKPRLILIFGMWHCRAATPYYSMTGVGRTPLEAYRYWESPAYAGRTLPSVPCKFPNL